MQNTYANECFMDELAAAANMDPLEFRRKYLDDKRGLELLERLATLAKWEKRPTPQKNAAGGVAKGRGISYVKYELVRTYVGAVAEVEVDRRTGVIHVPKLTVVHDCGQIINPDVLKNQIEGNVIQTVSRTLIEEDDGSPGRQPDIVAKARARGLAVYMWTFGAEAEITRRFMRMPGVTGVFTDNPDVAIGAWQHR